MTAQRQTVGIVGGLCPLATADIYLKAMRHVKVISGDADYPDIIINAAVEQEFRGNSFDGRHNYDMSHRIMYVYQVAAELQRQKVDRILVPDFLSHSSMTTISRSVQTPLIDLVAILIDGIRTGWPNARNIGILTTSWSIKQRIFERQFTANGLVAIYPDEEIQEQMVMKAIYGADGIKRGITTGKPGELIRHACGHLMDKGVDIIVTAVTELPLLDRHYYPRDKYLDCNEVIGRNLVRSDTESPVQETHCGTIGIIGGLGPAATVDIFEKIVRHTPAHHDQDHLKIIIENDPQIPDRTAALSGIGEDPSIAMLASAEKLKRSGADFLIIPCNTAHAFLRKMQQHIQIPILSMIDETARYITANHPAVKKIGLLATSGTVGSKVYEEALTGSGVMLLVPSGESQKKLVMEAIYGQGGIKAGCVTGVPREQLIAAAHELIGMGAQLIVLGCTEIPLVLKSGDVEVPFVDPTEILAKAAVEQAMRLQDGDRN